LLTEYFNISEHVVLRMALIINAKKYFREVKFR